MVQISEFNHSKYAMSVSTFNWANRDQKKESVLKTGVHYRKTRSTIALDASELIDLSEEETTETFKSLLKLSKFLNREEVVIESLGTLLEHCEDASIEERVNTIQHDITQICRKMYMSPPRIALEKRGSHFDLRVYPTFH